MTSRIAGLAGLLLAFALAGCGGEDGAKEAVRYDSADVEIVRHAGADRPLDWSFERVAVLGGESQGPESFTAVSAETVDTDSSGRLYVLDRDAHRVVVFDSALAVERTLGSEGEGPGELALPLALDVGLGGEVTVADLGRGGFVRWNAGGADLPMRRPGAVWYDPRFEHTTQGYLVALTEMGTGPDSSNLQRVAYLREDADPVTLFSRVLPATEGRYSFPSCGLSLPKVMGQVLEPELSWTYGSRSERVAVAPVVRYEIDFYRDATKEMSVRRDVDPRANTEEMARRQLGEGMVIRVSGEPVTCDTDEVIRERGMAPALQTVEALRFGPDGRLWVVRGHLEDEEPKFDVFAPDGAYLGTLPAGTPEPLIFLPDGRLVARTVDELDVERLAVYRVTEN